MRRGVCIQVYLRRPAHAHVVTTSFGRAEQTWVVLGAFLDAFSYAGRSWNPPHRLTGACCHSFRHGCGWTSSVLGGVDQALVQPAAGAEGASTTRRGIPSTICQTLITHTHTLRRLDYALSRTDLPSSVKSGWRDTILLYFDEHRGGGCPVSRQSPVRFAGSC